MDTKVMRGLGLILVLSLGVIGAMTAAAATTAGPRGWLVGDDAVC